MIFFHQKIFVTVNCLVNQDTAKIYLNVCLWLRINSYRINKASVKKVQKKKSDIRNPQKIYQKKKEKETIHNRK